MYNIEQIIKQQKEELKGIISNYDHQNCSGHTEGQYCHLDDYDDNEFNFLPKIMAWHFSSIAAVIEKIKNNQNRLNSYDFDEMIKKFNSEVKEGKPAKIKMLREIQKIEEMKASRPQYIAKICQNASGLNYCGVCLHKWDECVCEERNKAWVAAKKDSINQIEEIINTK